MSAVRNPGSAARVPVTLVADASPPVERYLDVLSPRPKTLALLGPAGVEAAIRDLERAGVPTEVIGRSTNGLPISALRVGNGPAVFAVIAGAHPDEPLGTATCLHLARKLHSDKSLEALRKTITLYLVPQANPDGAKRNEAWFGPWQKDADLTAYFTHVRRDAFSNDVEFGFPNGRGGLARPENRAIGAWFDRIGRIDHYVSLHSIFLSGGAWFLVNAADLAASDAKLEFLLASAKRAGLNLHDEESSSMFRRIRPGLHTAPMNLARLNSMEYVRRFNECPLALVTEMPITYDPVIASRAVADAKAAKAAAARISARLEAADLAAARASKIESMDLTPMGRERAAHLGRIVSQGHRDNVWSGRSTPTLGDIRYSELHIGRRHLAYLAVARSALEGSSDPRARAMRDELDDDLARELERFKGDYDVRHPSLEVQSKLQIATILSGLVSNTGHRTAK